LHLQIIFCFVLYNRKMIFWVKKYFMSNVKNDQRPHVLQSNNVRSMKKPSWTDTNTFHPSYKDHKSGYLLLAFSHVFNLIPIYFAIIHDFPQWFIWVLILQMIFSLLYHLFFTNKIFRFADWFFSLALIFSNIIILLSFHSSYFMYKIILVVVLILFAIKPSVKLKNYALNHSIWHFIAALITRIVLI